MQELNIKLQGPEMIHGPYISRGRCAAMFEGDWYR